MTTDITELAQSLKAAANTTADAIDRLKAFPGDELIDLSQHEGEQVDIDITTLNEWYELSSPANVLALVEALEKAKGMEAYWKTQCRGITDHCEELQARITELESRTVTPVTYSENADADYCRKWAWEQVKGEVSTEDWTTGDSITYFGFFCWGWDMRRQYNEQRPVTVKLPQRLQPGADGWDDWYVHSDDEGE
ncbi:TPA: hypothetical protein QH556_005787, partial [Klebsiella variicola]|nr:hypothetical protein [Klebsiella variicola]HDU5594267.1 hypothetical protein [Klebsiella variicola]